MSTYPAPDQYTPMVFNESSYLVSETFDSAKYLKVIGGQTVTNTDIFNAGIKTDTVQDVAGNSLLTKTGLGANVVSSSLTSLGRQTSGLNIASGQTYKVNSVDVLSATTLGANVVSSSLTSVGALSSLYVSGTTQVGGWGTSNTFLEIDHATDTTFMDFHSLTAGGNVDYDARIASFGGTSATSGQANVQIYAKQITLPTLTTLSVTGDVSVDTNVFKVDTTNNRVGVNTSAPSNDLEVVGDTYLSGTGRSLWIGANTTTAAQKLRVHQSGTSAYVDITGDNKLNFRFGTASETKFIIDSSVSTPSLTLGVRSFQIDHGTSTNTAGNGAQSFGFTFNTAPKVVATTITSATLTVYSVVVNGVSTTGFNWIKAYIATSGAAGGAGPDSFHWIAIG
jgi:hypothetical protein